MLESICQKYVLMLWRGCVSMAGKLWAKLSTLSPLSTIYNFLPATDVATTQINREISELLSTTLQRFISSVDYMFSPLSTEPITITTFIYKKEQR